MDFFDKQLDELEKKYNISQASDDAHAQTEDLASEDANASEKNNFDDIFWGSLIDKTYRKKGNPGMIIATSAVAVVLIMSCYMLITVILGKGWIANIFSHSDDRISFTLPVYDTPTLPENYYQSDGRYTTEGLAKALSPSVVSIVIYYDFSAQSIAAPTAQGSGIIISEDGYIITNAHVVDGDLRALKVVLHDETEYSARIVGSDIKSDIAVIKIDASGLQPAQIADSDTVSPGEDVVAIGSPAGLYGSITKGVVSAVGREIRTSSVNIDMECIQIDAAINPGNSGGALFNMWGQVVGIISSKLSAAYYDGIGFAISTNAAKPIIEELIEQGSIQSRVRIGITFYGIDNTAAEIYGYPISGLYIDEVAKDCDVSNTELQPGDVITHIEGKKVSSLSDTMKALEGYSPGDSVTAKVSRLNKEQTEVISTFEITFKLEKDSSSTSGFVEE